MGGPLVDFLHTALTSLAQGPKACLQAGGQSTALGRNRRGAPGRHEIRAPGRGGLPRSHFLDDHLENGGQQWWPCPTGEWRREDLPRLTQALWRRRRAGRVDWSWEGCLACPVGQLSHEAASHVLHWDEEAAELLKFKKGTELKGFQSMCRGFRWGLQKYIKWCPTRRSE